MEAGERDAYEALTCAASKRPYLYRPGIFDCLADVAGTDGNHPFAGRRVRRGRRASPTRWAWCAIGSTTPSVDASLASCEMPWANKLLTPPGKKGAALGIEEAIAYAQRGRGERKRPASGWPSLTPAERDVARLVCEGLANKDIAARLFVSPRTVQAHLTHIYTKLGIASRVQLVQEAARNA